LQQALESAIYCNHNTETKPALERPFFRIALFFRS